MTLKMPNDTQHLESETNQLALEAVTSLETLSEEAFGSCLSGVIKGLFVPHSYTNFFFFYYFHFLPLFFLFIIITNNTILFILISFSI